MAAIVGTLPEELRERLTCVICLELYKDPGTLSCGHSFCRPCVGGHWDTEEQAAGWAGTFTCPNCRKSYAKRPVLQRSVVLHDLVEGARAAASGSGFKSSSSSCQTAGAAAGHQCSRHGRALELYCSTEKRCVCCACSVEECRGHALVLIGDERRDREKILKERVGKNENQLKCTEAEIQKLEAQMTNYMDIYDKSIIGITVRFEQLQKAFEECKTLAVQSITRERASALEQADQNLEVLRCRLDALGQYQQQADELLQHTDDVAFLEAFSILPVPGPSEPLPSVVFNNVKKVEAITAFLSELSRLLQKEFPNTVHPEAASTKAEESSGSKTPAALTLEPTFSPKSELRTQLLQNYRNLTFDLNTAYKYIQLSKRNQEAKHMTSTAAHYPAHPERFESCWQVFCTECFEEGCHYWEVKISDYFVCVGVAYGNIERKKKCKRTIIGRNESSWSLQLQQTCPSAWENGKEYKLAAPMYKYIGVHLDFLAGTISFYGIKDKMELLHTFHCVFSAPLYPAFWIGEDTIVTLCQLPQSGNS